MTALKAALSDSKISLRKYDPTKTRPVYTSRGPIMISTFTNELLASLGPKAKKHPEIFECVGDDDRMGAMLEKHFNVSKDGAATAHSSVAHLKLNVDMSSNEPGMKKFFCTTKEELLDPGTSGQYYMAASGMDSSDAVQHARAVIPRYMPRRRSGLHPETNRVTLLKMNFFNTYIPSKWALWKMRNEKEWDALPSTPPKDVLRLLKHVIPAKEERGYFYGWLYTSLTSRSLVYLVLCGSPGVGKNRLKLLIRALHGENNSADGKKETFGANQSKFNSQMEENTLLWFDELKYGPDMEPRMKEYQNSYISIERKGVDATRSTEIFCSMIISNNYPRDNYLLFNSRKFAPLVLGTKSLTTSMTSEEIGSLSDRVDDTHPNFDVKFVAQIAKWILSIGKKYADAYPNLEYQGPMYWELAHSSMSRWQKISVQSLLELGRRGHFTGWDGGKQAYRWSLVEKALRQNKEFESKDYRDPSTVKAFFETYCDKQGKKIFEVIPVSGTAMSDFWIKPLIPLVASTRESSALIEDVEDFEVEPEKKKLVSKAKMKEWRSKKAPVSKYRKKSEVSHVEDL